MYRIKSNFQNICIVFIDCICIAVSVMIANYCRHYSFMKYQGITVTPSLIFMFIVAYFILYLIVNFNQGYQQKGLLHEAISIVKINICVVCIAIVLLYFTRIVESSFSRLVFGLTGIFSTVFMFGAHELLKYILGKTYKNSSSSSRVMLVSTCDRIRRVLENIEQHNEWSYKIIAVIAVDADRVGDYIEGIPVVAGRSGIVDYCKQAPLDEVYFYVDMEKDKDIKIVIEKVSSMGITVHLNIDLFSLDITSSKTMSKFGDYYTVTFANKFLSMRQMILKRLMDIAGSILGVILLLPMIVLIGPIIKLDSKGPVFFRQTRVGKNGRIFRIYKFRTMFLNAEDRKKELLGQNEMKGYMFKIENDPRITKVGRFLRRTSLDEFPQFLNILKGDMSLVGTRPPTVDEFEHYRSHHKRRLSITPGLTGLWQVSGRSEIRDFEKVVKLDVQYIENWSVGLDIKILMLTVQNVLKRRGAE